MFFYEFSSFSIFLNMINKKKERKKERKEEKKKERKKERKTVFGSYMLH